MNNLRRMAFVGVAALAGALGLSGVQSRIIARTNVESVRQSDKAGLPTPQAPAARTISAQTVAIRSRNGARAQFYGHPIWIGYMRAGVHGAWNVNRRGAGRVGRR